MSKTKFKYLFTGRYGANLYEALREQDFSKYEAREVEYNLTTTKTGGYNRDGFVSWLESELSYYKWAGCAKKAGVPSDNLSAWLMGNELPHDKGELEFREEYARGCAEDAAILHGNEMDDDIAVAYIYNLIKFADLPQDAQRKIKFLCARARKYDEKDDEIASKLRAFSHRLEQDTCERLIRVSGFYCDIHGGNAEYEVPVPRSAVLKCPSCGYPICPVCANMFEKDPKDIDEAREYVASCESVSGHAYCGYCGDYSVEFMLRFLRLIGCPVPPECEDFVQPKREARFYMTATIDALPNKDSILQAAIAAFNKGATGIIKIPDTTGEIWAFPERHPDGWLVTLCYPEER